MYLIGYYYILLYIWHLCMILGYFFLGERRHDVNVFMNMIMQTYQESCIEMFL